MPYFSGVRRLVVTLVCLRTDDSLDSCDSKVREKKMGPVSWVAFYPVRYWASKKYKYGRIPT